MAASNFPLWITFALVCQGLGLWMAVFASSVGTRKEVVCGNTDVRNLVQNFAEKLGNCTVIEGYLQILLIEQAEPPQYEMYSFPNLVEITEYLLLYRVYGLRTLSHLFPNLSVIRGQRLFFNYALVVFEMPDFESLGLGSLTTITRGAVRMEKNSALCYISTIDWKRITDVSEEDHFIMENKDNKYSDCVNLCPKSATGHDLCPINTNSVSSRYSAESQPLCWDSNHCQKVCPESCGRRSCFTRLVNGRNETACCHDECVGGCTGPRPENCTTCAHVVYNNTCRRQCPAGTYQYRDRRCLLAHECESVGDGLIGHHYWKVLPDLGVCAEDCPSGYTEHPDNRHRCQKCDNSCPKKCGALSIDNVSSAQKLKGCTIIDGILEIQIRGGNHVGRELEASLGQLEEVTEYVAIKRTYEISSLSFLRSLRRIGGERLYGDRYALVVFDNQNLQEIWDWETHPNLTINSGHVFFHYNRKLCQHKIQELVKHVGLENTTDSKDVAQDTNGDKITCETIPIKLEVVKVKDTFAVVRWENIQTTDVREILSWVINYREVEAENITIFSARDSCTADVWMTMDVRPDDDTTSSYLASFLHNLKPYTKYAMYVQTYTIAAASSGAISTIVYFTTMPDVPTPPRDIVVKPSGPTELIVSWKEPSSPNGNVTHYYVYWQPQVIKASEFDKRDYCKDRLVSDINRKPEQEEPENNQTCSGNCCECPKSTDQIKIEQQERAFQIEFENFLHDSVYVKREHDLNYDASEQDMIWDSQRPVPTRPPAPEQDNSTEPSRRKRQLRSPAPEFSVGAFGNDSFRLGGSYDQMLRNYTKNNNFSVEEEEVENPYEAAAVYFKKEIVLTNLRHFSEYNIEVIACHDYEEDRDRKHCSNRALAVARTLPQSDADTIVQENITVHNITGEMRAFIKWNEPFQPNGLILTYEIEFMKQDIENTLVKSRCITHKEFREKNGFETDNLEPGNWSFRVRATSLAGNGSWTQNKFFYIPKISVDVATDTSLIIGIVVSVVIVILAVAVFSIFFIRKKRDGGFPKDAIIASVNPEYWSTSNVYIPDEWEVPRDKISLLSELGQGSFGMVYEGIAKNLIDNQPEVKVAVKTVNENASIHDRIEFLNEASVMKAFSCNHVVKLLGVVSKGQPSLVIMELMAMGDLKTFLRSRRPDEEDNENKEPPSLKQILQMAGEIADGMAYLAAKKFVHRDLAARNCMVNEDMIVKIGDFGMTRDIYETDYYRKGGKGLLPVRWMAPESLKDGMFDSRSDVWSYGVVLWEMATLAAQPYQGLANEQVLQYVIDGGIMEKPEGCPDKLYDLMQLCWRHSPKQRPTFGDIICLLQNDLNQQFTEESYYFSDDNRENRMGVSAFMASSGLMGSSDDTEDSADVCTPLRTAEAPPPRTASLRRQPASSVGRSSARRGEDIDMNSLDDDDDLSSSCHSSEAVNPSPTRCSHLSSNCDCVDINKYSASGISAPPSRLQASGGRGLVNGQEPFGEGGGDNKWGRGQWSPSDSSAGSAIQFGNDGSKGSTKSSGSSHSGHLNGGVLNGHITRGYIPPPRC